MPVVSLQDCGCPAILLGEEYVLEPFIQGSLRLKFQWYFTPTGLMEDAYFLEHGNSTSLTLPSLRFEDNGTYWIEVSNELGSVLSEKVDIIVWRNLFFHFFFLSRNIKIGQNILSCPRSILTYLFKFR